MNYMEEQLWMEESDPRYHIAQGVFQHNLSLMDFDCWLHLEELLEREISYEDYHHVSQVYGYDLLDLEKADIHWINSVIDFLEKSCVYVVLLVHQHPSYADIETSSFSTRQLAKEFFVETRQKIEDMKLPNTFVYLHTNKIHNTQPILQKLDRIQKNN